MQASSHRFTFRTLPLAGRKREVVPTPATSASSRDESNELQALINGDFSTVSAVAPELRFQAIGSCPVPLRASVLRVVLFKLLGTGVFAALVAAGSSDPFVAKTCGLAAAINAVAVVHYGFSAPKSPIPCTCILLLTRLLCACVRACAVWKIRLQALNVKPLTAWMVGLGRATDAEGYDAQVYDNSSKLYAQEIAVDSLRQTR